MSSQYYLDQNVNSAVLRHTALSPSLVHLASSQVSDPWLWHPCGHQEPSELDLKLKHVEVMEKQEPENSRLASKVKVGSRIK